ncbi:hypothetical protein PVK06_011611 [Gossypium arboreum]|uniref:Secreted protein n=1 Tax=Gossypium arboreum TaxID=29729 RepID=A0ABR0QA93_GOSAR|nr:hypothetical protein PVK06_011611 [Gossypium arboreum]
MVNIAKFWLTQIGVANWLFKWSIFVHRGRDTDMCLSRVRHTVMLHRRVSPGVSYNGKLGSSTAMAHGCVASRVSQVRFDHSQSTQACLVAV